MKKIVPGLSNAEYIAMVLDKDQTVLYEKMGGEVGVGMGMDKEPLPSTDIDSKHGEISRASESSYYYTFMIELYGRVYRGVLEIEPAGRGGSRHWLKTLEVPSIQDMKRWELYEEIIKLKCFYKSANGSQKVVDLTDSKDEEDLYEELLEVLLRDTDLLWALQDFAGTEIENIKYASWLEMSAQFGKNPKGPVGLEFSYDFEHYSMSSGREFSHSNVYNKTYSGTLEVTFDDGVNLFNNLLFKGFIDLKKQPGNGSPDVVYVDGNSREAYDLFNNIELCNKSFEDAIVGFESSFDDRGDYE